MTEDVSKPTGVRKKFATPPVKIACLSCRSSRTRCDGNKPCSNCDARSRECVYLPSRRGGARVRKKHKGAPEKSESAPAWVEEVVPPPEPLPIQNYIDPGAGLSQLPDWFQDSDFMFDGLFTAPWFSDGSGAEVESGNEQPTPGKPAPMVRAYTSDAAIMEAYYLFIHMFFPILPAPDHIPADHVSPRHQNQVESFEDGFESASPVGLAISAILALIPCTDDADPQNPESVLFRRKYSQYLAQSALETIEAEQEIPDSSIEPQRALEEPPEGPAREPFHRGVPLELESIIALNLLSVYEYAQRGNLKKTQSRGSQALMAAMALSLHSSSEDDEYSDIRRRVWWMTYMTASQASVVSNTKPPFAIFSPSFTADFPSLGSDSTAFATFIQSQQAILSSTQFVMELKKTVMADGDMAPIYERMSEIEAFLKPLIAVSDSWTFGPTIDPVGPDEQVVSRALRCIARIKLNSARIKVHRYHAFQDRPIFTTKHCDLTPKPPRSEGDNESSAATFCSYGPLIASYPPSLSVPSSNSGSPPFKSSESTPSSHSDFDSWTSMPGTRTGSPFSKHESSKICLQSAFNIVQAFEDLPYPNTSGKPHEGPGHLSPTSAIVVPRTMPSFACCAMQCAYTFLMVRERARAAHPVGPGLPAPPLVAGLLGLLHKGLESILATVANYSSAFEALGGMRDQIRGAIDAQPEVPVICDAGSVPVPPHSSASLQTYTTEPVQAYGVYV